jgi:hypothetical protein
MAIICAPINGKTKLNASRITLSVEPGCKPTEHERIFLFRIKAKEKDVLLFCSVWWLTPYLAKYTQGVKEKSLFSD